MSEFWLAGYVSPTSSPPTFLIPIFTCYGYNTLFAQDLSRDGLVKRFMCIQTELFHEVNAILPVMSTKVGNSGLLAYWNPSGDVSVGTPQELATVLRCSPDYSDPFAGLEIARAIGDDAAARAAISVISNQFIAGEAGDRWASRTQSAFQAASQVAPDVVHDAPDQAFEDLLTELQRNPERIDWAEVWNDAWYRLDEDVRLAELAFWWLDHPMMSEEGAGIVLTALLYFNTRDTRPVDASVKWLVKAPFYRHMWPHVLNQVLPRASEQDAPVLQELALRYLRHGLPGSYTLPYVWSTLWGDLWRSGTHRSAVVAIAREAALGISRRGTFFIEAVMAKLLAMDEREDWVVSSLAEWLLSKSRNSRLWAETFLAVAKLDNREVLLNQGREWLAKNGRASNKWWDVWLFMERSTPPESLFLLGVAWLKSSLQTLRVWPLVFNHLVQYYIGFDDDQLKVIGEAWLERPRSSRLAKNAYIDMAPALYQLSLKIDHRD